MHRLGRKGHHIDMMLSTKTIERFIRLAGLSFLVGVACWFAGFYVTGLMFVGLGAMGGSMGAYRTERGIWMLGALYLVVFASLIVMRAAILLIRMNTVARISQQSNTANSSSQ